MPELKVVRKEAGNETSDSFGRVDAHIEAEVLEEPSEGAAGPEELLPEAETAFSEAEDPTSDDEAIDAGPDESVQETEASDTEDEEAGPEGRIFDAEEDKAAEEKAAAEEDALPEQEAGTSEPDDPVPADSEEIDADLPEETDADVPEGTETVEEDTSETGGFDNAGEAEDAFQDVLTDPQDAAEQETPEEASSALEEETAGEPLKEEVSEERLQSGADPEEENSEQEYGELYVWSEGNPYESSCMSGRKAIPTNHGRKSIFSAATLSPCPSMRKTAWGMRSGISGLRRAARIRIPILKMNGRRLRTPRKKITWWKLPPAWTGSAVS